MQITAPAPIIYLPENLWSIFTRPGRELLIRVIGIEGKTLSLELGGEKFQARIGGTLTPEDFKIGEVIRVRIAQVGHPIVLEIISSEEKTSDLRFLYLMTQKIPVQEKTQQYAKFSPPVDKEISLIIDFLKNLTQSYKSEKKEIKKEYLKDLFGKNIKTLNILYENNKIIIPFLFSDERSWGYLELSNPEEKDGKIKLFYIRLFMEYLGLIEIIFSYLKNEVYIDLFFSNKIALEIAKKNIPELKEKLNVYKISAKLRIEYKEAIPGYLFRKEG